jgi:hypothetical protein
MAFLTRIDSSTSQPLSSLTEPLPACTPADFSALEWSVIRLARVDRLWTIRTAGPLRRWWNWLAGRGNPALANPRLEALRRMAVLSWHYGFTVPGDDVAAFLSEGFSPSQYELMVNYIRRRLTPRTAPMMTESLA